MSDQAGRSDSLAARAAQFTLAAGLIACYLFLPWQGYVTKWTRASLELDPSPAKVRWVSGLALCQDLALLARGRWTYEWRSTDGTVYYPLRWRAPWTASRTLLTATTFSIPPLIAVIALGSAISPWRLPRILIICFAAALLVLAAVNWLQAGTNQELLYEQWVGHGQAPASPHPLGFVSYFILSVGLAVCWGWRALSAQARPDHGPPPCQHRGLS